MASIPHCAAKRVLLRPRSHLNVLHSNSRRSFASASQQPVANLNVGLAESILPDVQALHEWTRKATQTTSIVTDTLRTEHLENLYITLPTRDGSRRTYAPPAEGDPLGHGHNLVFFYPKNPESNLRVDGSDPVFCPPSPFTRRMWAGGRFEWKLHGKDGLCIGDRAKAVSRVKEVQTRGFDKQGVLEKGVPPMVFVKQHIKYSKEGSTEVAVEEERTHVYLSQTADRRAPRDGELCCVVDLHVSLVLMRRPVIETVRPDASFEFVPTDTTLFRFSALTWNAHKIHLCKEFAQASEGYPGKRPNVDLSNFSSYHGYVAPVCTERLVHGPLTSSSVPPH